MQNIDIYYESLQQVYTQILNWPKRTPPFYEKIVDGLLIGSVVVFIVSLIPILPVVLSFSGLQIRVIAGSLKLGNSTLENFIAIWILSAVLSGVIMFMMIMINAKIDSLAGAPPKPPQTLSPEQLAFVMIYEAYKELKIFFVSHVEQHISNSLKALAKALIDNRDLFYYKVRHYASDVEKRGYAIYFHSDAASEEISEILTLDDLKSLSDADISSSFPKQVEVASEFLRTFEKYAWFQLDAKTKFVLQALISFSEKIPSRLKNQEDLPAVLSVLENLSKFLYAYLPEHKTYMDPAALAKLHEEGRECLYKFSEEINNLTPYQRRYNKQKVSETKNSSTLTEKIAAMFYSNIFFRFTIWFILILVLTSTAVFVINQRVVLSPDTMVTVVVGTSVASAAALAGLLPKRSKKNDD